MINVVLNLKLYCLSMQKIMASTILDGSPFLEFEMSNVKYLTFDTLNKNALNEFRALAVWRNNFKIFVKLLYRYHYSKLLRASCHLFPNLLHLAKQSFSYRSTKKKHFHTDYVNVLNQYFFCEWCLTLVFLNFVWLKFKVAAHYDWTCICLFFSSFLFLFFI